MIVTKTWITMIQNPRGKALAFADLTMDDCLVINGARVIDGPHGLFVAMPSRKREDGAYADIVHPITTELRNHITEVVLAAYQEALDG